MSLIEQTQIEPEVPGGAAGPSRGAGHIDLKPHVAQTSNRMTSAIRQVVLLSGTVRMDRFTRHLGRSILELPIDVDHTLLGHWGEQVAGLAPLLGREAMSVRVMLDRASPLPELPATNGRVEFTVEQDPYDYRGTGGVLRDMAEAYDADDDYLLVANGAQVIVGSLARHVAMMAKREADVVVVGHRDGTPSGLMLVRCGALRMISPTGFVDMKEQALPMIAERFDVRVALCDQPTAQPVRTLSDYLHAMRIYHTQMAARPVDLNPFAENLQSTFAVVEPGAKVDGEALLHDSVVLRGATVEAGAVVVRSLVGPGARVRRGQRLVDRLLGGAGRASQRSTAT